MPDVLFAPSPGISGYGGPLGIFVPGSVSRFQNLTNFLVGARRERRYLFDEIKDL